MFARHLNVTAGLVSQWESGEKRPRSASLGLLTLPAARNGRSVFVEDPPVPEDTLEQPKQVRPAVVRAQGVTPSERYLGRLAENSFLNLWSYPTPYRDQKQAASGDGKELCDLLVVCGKYVIIFSEKSVSWPKGKLEVAWARWAKRAIRDAARQAGGAERWITDHPNRIFLDRECTREFPIDLPPPEGRSIHRVVVASGAAGACKQHLIDSSGSLVIRPDIKGDAHWLVTRGELYPFMVGDVDPTGSFVHVFNETSLEVLMNELDTITDFAEYLDKKATFVRSGRLLQANGEENLLAYYATRVNDDGEHDFVLTSGLIEDDSASLMIDGSQYPSFTQDARYVAKKEADKASYIWDALITTFTTPMLEGTTVAVGEYNYKYEVRQRELAVRYMALERRFVRRSHGEAIEDALRTGQDKEIFFRLMLVPEGKKLHETAFFFMTATYTGSSQHFKSYEEYRKARIGMLHVYARGILERYSYLKRAIGVACEPPGQEHGGSEDLIYAEQAEWTDEQRREIKEHCRRLNVFRRDLDMRLWEGEEYPDVVTVDIEQSTLKGQVIRPNRRRRRAMAAKKRKASKRM